MMFENLSTEALEKMKNYLVARVDMELEREDHIVDTVYEDLGRVAYHLFKRTTEAESQPAPLGEPPQAPPET